MLAAAEATAQGRRIVATAIAVAVECGLPLQLVSVVAAEAERAQAAAFVDDMLGHARRAGVDGGEPRRAVGAREAPISSAARAILYAVQE